MRVRFDAIKSIAKKNESPSLDESRLRELVAAGWDEMRIIANYPDVDRALLARVFER